MFAAMVDEPLSLATLLRHASTFQSAGTVSAWTGSGALRARYADGSLDVITLC